MAKRVRYSGRLTPKHQAKRPAGAAGAPATSRLVPAPEPVDMTEMADELARPSSGHLTEGEVRRAEQNEAEIAAAERASLAEAVRRRARSRVGETYVEDVNAPLSVRAAHEYAYVARDVRRILLTGGLMVAILAALAVAVNVLGIITL